MCKSEDARFPSREQYVEQPDERIVRQDRAYTLHDAVRVMMLIDNLAFNNTEYRRALSRRIPIFFSFSSNHAKIANRDRPASFLHRLCSRNVSCLSTARGGTGGRGEVRRGYREDPVYLPTHVKIPNCDSTKETKERPARARGAA